MKRFNLIFFTIFFIVSLTGCTEKEYTPKEVAQEFIERAKKSDSSIYDIMTEKLTAKMATTSAMKCVLSAGKVEEINDLCTELENEFRQPMKVKENILKLSKEIALYTFSSDYKNDDTNFKITNENNSTATAVNDNGTKVPLININGTWKVGY